MVMGIDESQKKLFGGKVPVSLINEFKAACEENGCVIERGVEAAMRVWSALPVRLLLHINRRTHCRVITES